MPLFDQTGQDPPVEPSDASPGSAPHRIWFWRAAIVTIVVLLLLRAGRSQIGSSSHSGWTIQDSSDLAWWFGGIVLRQLFVFTLFLLLGALIPVAWTRDSVAPAGARHGTRLLLTWFGLVCALVVVCSWMSVGTRPHLAAFVVPLLGYSIGLRLGISSLRGAKALAWSAAQVAIVTSLLAVLGSVYLKLAIVGTPLDFEPVRMTDTEKHRLTNWIRDTQPRPGEPHQLRLTDDEIDGLCNAVLERGLAERKARIRSQPDRIVADASIVLPARFTSRRHYLNVHAVGLVRIDDGQLTLRCDQLEIGGLAIPRGLLRIAAPVAQAFLLDDPQVREIVTAIQLLEPEPGALNTLFRPGALSRRVVPALVQLIWDRPDVAAETQLYVRRLVEVFPTLPADSDRFGRLLQAAFQLARERSVDNDPLLENRAAIFAPAILLGQKELQPLVGAVLDAKLQAQADPLMDVVELRGRHDWPRHFLVSAAVALLASEQASDRIGVLKEQLDSQEGGSGFSFGDLLADRAGTRLALAAIRDESSARTLQSRLSAGFKVDEFFPPADGLPEGIPDAEFASQYGGIDGPGYRQLSEEIDRRIERLRPIE